MHRTACSIAALALATIFSSALGAPAAAKDQVKVAFIGPLTGGVSANGLGGRNSADLAVRLRNAEPAAKYQYEMIVLDDECKPNIGVQVATKVAADNDVVAGVTHYCSAVAIGKALGAGVPIGAALFSERVAAAAGFGDHGSTYGGNLLACRAALVFLDELIDRDLLSNVGRVGRQLETGLTRLASRHPIIRDVRGAGVMWGIELDAPAAPVYARAVEHGVAVTMAGEKVIRLLPPLTITKAELELGIERLQAALA